MKTPLTGPFAAHLQKYIELRGALGHSVTTSENHAKSFDRFTLRIGLIRPELSEELAMSYVIDGKNGESGSKSRCSFIRQFAQYLINTGVKAYVLPVEFYPQGDNFSYKPHIFSDEELAAFFSALDIYDDPIEPFAPIILSTCFRLAYTCGLRPSEMRSIKLADVDLKQGTVYIRKTKTHQDRIVAMSEAMTVLLENYVMLREVMYPNSEYLFPAPSGDMYESEWFLKKMRKVYALSNPQTPAKKINSIRVYDLRHQFATNVVANWLKMGADLENKLAYLQMFMGHTSLSQTMYYVHLQPAHLLAGAKIEWTELNSIIPEVPND